MAGPLTEETLSQMSAPYVMSTGGPTDPETLRAVLMHEHLIIDLRPNTVRAADAETSAIYEQPVCMENLALLRRNPISSKDNCVVNDLAIQRDEISQFARLGGGTIVDVTPQALGRDVLGLRDLAESTGLTIVAGCGYYTHPCHEAHVSVETDHQLARRLVDDLTVGVSGTGVRAGIIGELGTSDPVHPDELKILRAAAAAQAVTDTSIYLHVLSQTAHELLDELEAAGAMLSRVIVGHQDLVLGSPTLNFPDAIDYFVSILDRGATIAFDCCGKSFSIPQMPGLAFPVWTPSDIERAKALRALCNRGFVRQLIVSHDVCHKSDLRHFGGNGYGHILRSFSAALTDTGLTADDQTQILEANPKFHLSRSDTIVQPAGTSIDVPR